MKANRKVMFGAALVVAIVALAGVGYATYQGTTTSSNNQITTEYVNINLNKTTGDGVLRDTTVWNGQTLAVTFDSVNTNGTIAYTLNSGSVGKKLVIDVDVGGNNATQTYNLTIDVPAVSEPGVTGTWTYKIGNNEITANAGTITVSNQTTDNLDGQLILTLSANEVAGTPDNTIAIGDVTFTVVSTS